MTDKSLIPDWYFTSEENYERELTHIFRGDHWNFVGLEVEIPNIGDFKRSFVGPTAVVVSRARDNSIHVFENRCTHRGVEFCREAHGNTGKTFVCPLHQWSFDLKGDLVGVPYTNGIKGKGGMPDDFDKSKHNLKKLRVATYAGIVFATYSNNVESIEEYLGERVIHFIDLLFKDKTLRVNEYRRHKIKANWKVYIDNLRDTYHFPILHSYFLNFGLFKTGNPSKVFLDDKHGVHSVTATAKQTNNYADVDSNIETEMVNVAKLKLNDERFLSYKKEISENWSSFVITIFPGFMINKQMNGMSVRRLIPMGPNESYLEWTMLGYAEDSEEMKLQRMRQDNFHGPAGIITMEDIEAMQFLQEGYTRSTTENGVIKLDIDNSGGEDNNLITEEQIRSMYSYYRKAMKYE